MPRRKELGNGLRTARGPGALLLALACVLAPAGIALRPVLEADFVEFDDDVYVTDNPHVLGGLTWAGVAWALGATTAANWHPLTWISHMIDVELHGDEARGHHLTSLLLHLLNAVLLFMLLQDATRAVGRSAFVAALFAVHPLHVESVAWISERKDLVSTFFWFLATWIYVGHARRPSVGRIATVAAAMAAALMAKPMPVTLPFTLLLLDVWPLARWDGTKRGFSRLAMEKLPLFALSAVSSVVTLLVQRAGEAVQSLDRFPAGARVANAAIAYVLYLAKSIWPVNLAVLYPHAGESIPAWKTAGAVTILAGISALAVVHRKRAPWMLVGWLFYLGTLVPVIGLVQVGGQAMADRYTYVPLVGIFVMAAWGVSALAALTGAGRRSGPAGDGTRAPGWLAVPAAMAVLALATVTWNQAAVWRNSETLFGHAIAVTEENALAHNKLGRALAARGDLGGAVAHLEEALRIRPSYSEAHNNLGGVLASQGRLDEAIRHYESALAYRPGFAAARVNLGAVLARRGRTVEAVREFEKAVEIDPGYAKARNNLGAALLELGRATEALRELDEAVRLEPGYRQARLNRARALAALGRSAEAEAERRAAERLGFRKD